MACRPSLRAIARRFAFNYFVLNAMVVQAKNYRNRFRAGGGAPARSGITMAEKKMAGAFCNSPAILYLISAV
jgi:hypothetical protein